ncbi:hypothetical protein BGX33_005214, partial [Mortierella sp. NVP41]
LKFPQKSTALSAPSAATAHAAVDTKIKFENPIAPWGTWSGDRIVIIGDYNQGAPPFLTPQETTDLEGFHKESEAGFTRHDMSLYDFASERFKSMRVSEFYMDNIEKEFQALFPKQSETHHLVLNLDKKEYLDPKICSSPEFEAESLKEVDGKMVKMDPPTFVDDFAHQQDGIMQGLFSLLFYSNGEGGGDIEAFRFGKWAGDRISIEEKETVEDLAEWRDISAEVNNALNEHLRTEENS